ncbi:MAG: hypothetical protein RL189_1201 [Pseudomonadota bacterium]
MQKFKTQSEYINSFPSVVGKMLKEMRRVILEEAPMAEQTISYGMAAFRVKKTLVYIGGFKNHVSFFPTSSGIKAFRSELTEYKISKGTIQFKIGEKIPLQLLRKIVRFRIKELQSSKNKASSCDRVSVAKFDYSQLAQELHCLPKPAQRALIRAGLLSKKSVLSKTDDFLLSLHGFGPKALQMLRN